MSRQHLAAGKIFVICQQLKLCVREIEVDLLSKKAENLYSQFSLFLFHFSPKVI